MNIRNRFIIIALCIIIGHVNLNAQWKIQNIYPNLGSVSSMYFSDSQKGLAIADKPYKTTDGGKTWIQLKIENFNTESRLYSTAKNVLWLVNSSLKSIRSTDGGETWKIFPDSQKFRLFEMDFINSMTGFAMGFDTTNNDKYIIYKTVDEGKTWEEVCNFSNSNGYLVMKFTSEKTGYVYGLGIFQKTTDGGKNWNPIIIDTSYTNLNFTVLSFVSDSIGIVSGYVSIKPNENERQSITMKTTDGGKNWKLSNQLFYAISFYDDKTAYACGAKGLVAKTTDCGETWKNINPQISSGLNLISVFNQNEAIFFGGGEPGKMVTIVKTTNSGNSWERYDSGQLYYFVTLKFVDRQTGWGGGNNGQIYKTTNGGLSWFQQRDGSSNEVLQAGYFIDTLNGWYLLRDPSFQQTTIIRTTNGGKSWDSLFTIPYSIYSVYFHNKLSGFVCGSGGRIYHTTNGGKTWKFVSTSFSSYYLTKITFTDEKHGWATGDKYIIIKTTDGGETWFSCLDTWGRYNDVVFADSLHGWATGVCDFIEVPFTRTMNGGNSWKGFRLNLPSQMYGLNFPSVKTGYAIGTSNVMCKTADSGATWHQLNFPDSRGINDISFADDSTGWAATANGLIFHTTNGGEEPVNPVNEEKNNTLNDFYLSQNYPNPFNPTTTIKYSIPKESRVSIIIYNTLGQKTKELVNETKPAGSYQVTFDGTGLTSGIYFYQLTAGSFSQTKKLILIK